MRLTHGNEVNGTGHSSFAETGKAELRAPGASANSIRSRGTANRIFIFYVGVKLYSVAPSGAAPILRGAPLGGESERTFFTFFKLGCRKHTAYMTNSMPPLLPAIVGTGEGNR